MKKTSTFLIGILSAQLLLAAAVYAQETLDLKTPVNAVIIDGDSKEWGDSLTYYNAEKNIHYTIANDKNNLYLVVKTNDLVQQNAILASGITFSIDTKGRKKSAFSVTFPVSGVEAINRPANTLEEKRLRADITKLRKIGIKGFKDVEENQINVENAFKIQTAINFDDNDYLVYEEAVPLELFHAAELIKNDWSFNIKLNAVTIHDAGGPVSMGHTIMTTTVLVKVPAGSGPPSTADIEAALRNSISRQSNIPRAAPQSDIEISKAIDFWGKFSLANN
ncbi:MAG: hypothetical protein ABI367_10455 [Mucilaginibacter sp.]